MTAHADSNAILLLSTHTPSCSIEGSQDVKHRPCKNTRISLCDRPNVSDSDGREVSAVTLDGPMLEGTRGTRDE